MRGRAGWEPRPATSTPIRADPPLLLGRLLRRRFGRESGRWPHERSEAAGTRRRIRPSDRFEGTERLIDLERAFAALPEESEVRHGHMQKALYRHGPTTTAIFDFRAGAGLDEYELSGQTIIHVLSGALRVRTSHGVHGVGPNQVLLLDPGVAQELRAVEPTRMLLTVILEDGF